jgi:hypothetical protein
LSAATLSCAVNCLRSFFMESPPHGFYTNPREKTLQIQGRQNTAELQRVVGQWLTIIFGIFNRPLQGS